MGQLLIIFGAGNTSNRREGAAVGTAHDELQVADAYIRHGAIPTDQSVSQFQQGIPRLEPASEGPLDSAIMKFRLRGFGN